MTVLDLFHQHDDKDQYGQDESERVDDEHHDGRDACCDAGWLPQDPHAHPYPQASREAPQSSPDRRDGERRIEAHDKRKERSDAYRRINLVMPPASSCQPSRSRA